MPAAAVVPIVVLALIGLVEFLFRFALVLIIIGTFIPLMLVVACNEDPVSDFQRILTPYTYRQIDRLLGVK